jgi:hypothetical protein
MYKPSFSIDRHDSDGDIFELGVFLDLGNGVTLKFESREELELFSDNLDSVIKEIKRDYQHR